MPYMIYTVDKPDSRAVRDAHRAAHYEFLQRHQKRLIASGGLQDDAGEVFNGGTILLDVDTRQEAQAFVDEDPFTHAGLAQTVVITRWKMAFFDGARVAPPQEPRT
ncbi:MAG: YciI family protein [Burkholderiaceae bacterium]|nr:YciI family protein [Burkholderiaceae bacterium]